MKYDALVAHAEANQIELPEGRLVNFGGVTVTRYDIPKGVILVSHCHVYDHPSILAQGVVEFWTPDGLRTIEGPCEILVPAGTKHAVQSLTDAVWYCLHKEEKH